MVRLGRRWLRMMLRRTRRLGLKLGLGSRIGLSHVGQLHHCVNVGLGPVEAKTWQPTGRQAQNLDPACK